MMRTQNNRPFIFYASFIVAIYTISLLGEVAYATNTIVSIENRYWLLDGIKTNSGSPAEGLLMNVRMVNAIFEDTGAMREKYAVDFDKNENTKRFIQSIPDYVASGINAFTISLQGGYPGYEGAVNSAYTAKGLLRQSYMERVDKVIKACDQNGVAVILTCFYQRQYFHERALVGRHAIKQAVLNVARWISEKKYKNVILEIANEYNHPGYKNWNGSRGWLSSIIAWLGLSPTANWLRSADGQVDLILAAKAINPNLLISTSGVGDGKVAKAIAKTADFIILHYNNINVTSIPKRIQVAHQYGKPVVCNEDDKIKEAGSKAALISVKSGAGWGFMNIKKNQIFPFQFNGVGDDTIVYNMIEKLTSKDRDE